MTHAEQKAALAEKLKGAPQKFIDYNLKSIERMQFKDDDDFNSYADEVASDLQELKQQAANEKVKAFGGHPSRPSSISSNKEDIKAKADEIVSKMLGVPPKTKAPEENEKISQAKKIVKNLMKY